jgi:hypothetical protein
LTVGAEHDSNVVLEPDRPPYPTDRESDTRAILYASANLRAVTDKPVEPRLEYVFYQSIHESLKDFDVQYHRVAPRFVVNAWARSQPSVGYLYEYTRYGGERYSDGHGVEGTLLVREGKRWATEVSGKYVDRTYWNSDLFERNSELSGAAGTAKLLQRLTFKGGNAEVYAAFDSESADEDYWAFQGYRAGSGLLARAGGRFYLRLSAEYSDKRYDEPLPSYERKRHDGLWQLGASLTLALSDRWSVTVSGSHTDSDSNLSLFEYKRDVTSVFVSAML